MRIGPRDNSDPLNFPGALTLRIRHCNSHQARGPGSPSTRAFAPPSRNPHRQGPAPKTRVVAPPFTRIFLNLSFTGRSRVSSVYPPPGDIGVVNRCSRARCAVGIRRILCRGPINTLATLAVGPTKVIGPTSARRRGVAAADARAGAHNADVPGPAAVSAIHAANFFPRPSVAHQVRESQSEWSRPDKSACASLPTSKCAGKKGPRGLAHFPQRAICVSVGEGPAQNATAANLMILVPDSDCRCPRSGDSRGDGAGRRSGVSISVRRPPSDRSGGPLGIDLPAFVPRTGCSKRENLLHVMTNP